MADTTPVAFSLQAFQGCCKGRATQRQSMFLTHLVCSACDTEHDAAWLQNLCTKCHKPESSNVVMALSSSMANEDAIIQKIQKGSMGMPAFPNIKGEPAQRVAEFVLTHSKPK